MVLTTFGEVFTWGKNDHGELGIGTEYILAALKPTKLDEFHSMIKQNHKNEFVIQIATGFNHAACMTNEGTVFVWGKGLFPQDMEYSELPLIDPFIKNMFRPCKAKLNHH